MSKTLSALTAALLFSAVAFAQTAAPKPAPSTTATPGAATTTPATTSPAQSGGSGATSTGQHGKSSMGKSGMGKSGMAGSKTMALVHINRATARQLETLPGISKKLAAEIIKDRPFKNSMDLETKVKGIGMKNIKKMLPHISFT